MGPRSRPQQRLAPSRSVARPPARADPTGPRGPTRALQGKPSPPDKLEATIDDEGPALDLQTVGRHLRRACSATRSWEVVVRGVGRQQEHQRRCRLRVDVQRAVGEMVGLLIATPLPKIVVTSVAFHI